jgi:hypothetical protein
MAIGRLLKPTRGRPQCGREPDVLKLALERLGTGQSGRPVRLARRGLQRSVREWAIRQGWGGRPVCQEQAQGILVAALGMLAGCDCPKAGEGSANALRSGTPPGNR